MQRPLPDLGEWPPLEWEQWKDTAETLHMYMQIVGKTRLALSPIQNHWWNIAFYLTGNPFQAAYYGEDAPRWPEQSTLGKLAETSLPCFYTVSEFDPPDFQRQAAWLVEAHTTRLGRWPRLMQLAGHNHLSSVLQIGSPVDTLGPELLRFIRASVLYQYNSTPGLA